MLAPRGSWHLKLPARAGPGKKKLPGSHRGLRQPPNRNPNRRCKKILSARCGARTHDLEIMRLTRCQLRQSRGGLVFRSLDRVTHRRVKGHSEAQLDVLEDREYYAYINPLVADCLRLYGRYPCWLYLIPAGIPAGATAHHLVAHRHRGGTWMQSGACQAYADPPRLSSSRAAPTKAAAAGSNRGKPVPGAP